MFLSLLIIINYNRLHRAFYFRRAKRKLTVLRANFALNIANLYIIYLFDESQAIRENKVAGIACCE